jgi:tRNA1(Val) A37 N6-methylase TrmN6
MVGRIIQGLGRRFGAVEIIPFWPKSGEPAKRVIIQAIKDRKPPASIPSIERRDIYIDIMPKNWLG